MLYKCGITHSVSNRTSSQHAHEVTQPVLPWLTKCGSFQGFQKLWVSLPVERQDLNSSTVHWITPNTSSSGYDELWLDLARGKLQAHFNLREKHSPWDLLSKEWGCESRDSRLQVWQWGCRKWKMCIVYFFWTVLSEQNTKHKCKTILSPLYGPP